MFHRKYSCLTRSTADRSPPLPPPKSWAWMIEPDGRPHWPTDFGGTAVYWRSDRGDANGFTKIPFAKKSDKQPNK